MSLSVKKDVKAYAVFYILYSIFINSCVQNSEKRIIGKGIRILEFDSMGIHNDALILQDAFKVNGKDTRIEQVDEVKDGAAINIFLQVIHLPATRFAGQNWLVPNPEFAPSVEDHQKVDVVLCKSHSCHKLYTEFKKQHQLKFEILYIGFTSLDTVKEVDFSKKDLQLFFHPAGKSRYKQTRAVLEAWEQHPEFGKLVVTCINMNRATDCYNTHIKDAQTLARFTSKKNIVIHDKYLSSEEIEKLQETAAFVVAPSEIEGFGHYLNEARSFGAVVLTTDFSPMNETIRSDYGFLLPSTPGMSMGRFSIPKQVVAAKDIANVVKRCMEMKMDEFKKMSAKARDSFYEDQKIFYKNISELVQRYPDL